MVSKAVEYTKSLVKAVESSNYNGTVESMGKICEEVLGYKKIAESSFSEDGDSFDLDGDSAFDLLSDLCVSKEMMCRVKEEIIERIKYDTRFFHYGTGLSHHYEGIVNVLYFKTEQSLQRSRDSPNLPLGSQTIVTHNKKLAYDEPYFFSDGYVMDETPILFSMYGNKWFGKGELDCVPQELKPLIKLPDEINIVDNLTLNEFVDAVRQF
ncbi:MAG: hypothetical protein ABIE55_01300 [Candidatus Aenigmatarchaeota archaeon]